jgi:N-acetylneuraminic acid mutarotase
MFEYSIESHIWYNISSSAVGDRPSPRYRLEACAFNNKIYIFGGVNDQQVKFKELYEYDLGLKEWSRVESQGRTVSPRSFHKMIGVGCVMIVFGGIDDRKRNDLHAIKLSKKTVRHIIRENYSQMTSERESNQQGRQDEQNVNIRVS